MVDTVNPETTDCARCGYPLWGSYWVLDHHVDCQRAEVRRLQRQIDRLDEMACDILQDLKPDKFLYTAVYDMIDVCRQAVPLEHRPKLHWPPTPELGPYGERLKILDGNKDV